MRTLGPCPTCERLPMTLDGVRIVPGRDEVWYRCKGLDDVFRSGNPGSAIYWDNATEEWYVEGTRELGDDADKLVSDCYSREELVP